MVGTIFANTYSPSALEEARTVVGKAQVDFESAYVVNGELVGVNWNDANELATIAASAPTACVEEICIATGELVAQVLFGVVTYACTATYAADVRREMVNLRLSA